MLPERNPNGSNSKSPEVPSEPPASSACDEDSRKFEWSRQYIGELGFLDSIGPGEGEAVLACSNVDMVSPFADWAYLDINEGHAGGYMNIARIPGSREETIENFCIVPFRVLDQVFIVFDTNADNSPEPDGLLQVIIVPKAAAGASPLFKQCPEIIHFKWPNRKLSDGGLGERPIQLMESSRRPWIEDSDTYLSILKDCLNTQLRPQGKEVRVCVRGATNVPVKAGPLFFRSPAILQPVDSSPITEHLAGCLYFTSTGILWFSHVILYFPVDSLEYITTALIHDISSKEHPDDSSVIKLGVEMCVLEPYPEKGKQPESRLLWFSVDFNIYGAHVRIKEYARKHCIGLKRMELTHQNYKNNELIKADTLDE